MAQSRLDNNSASRPVTGMNRDSAPSITRENSTRFVLNGMLEDKEDGFGSITNEFGNEQSFNLPSGHKLVGHIPLGRNDTVLFSTDGTASTIGIQHQNDTYEQIISDNQLNFSTSNPIRGFYRMRNGCERVIYFNDHLNPDRRINLDDLNQYRNSSGAWNTREFDLQLRVPPPVIQRIQVNDYGGNMYNGNYQFAIEVLDDNLNRISLSKLSSAVTVYRDDTSTDFPNLDGSYNLASGKKPEVGGTPRTSKSATLTVSSIPTDYPYLRIYVARLNSHDGITYEVFKHNELISNNFTGTQQITFTGETPDWERTVIDELTIGQPEYISSLQMQNISNRLVRANVKGNYRDYRGYQRQANNITIKWHAEYHDPMDSRDPYSATNPQRDMAYQPDEIYAFGIVYQFDDGTLSPAFHIPGRIMESNHDDVIINRGPDTSHLPPLQAPVAGYPKWKVFNTAKADGTMAYWEHDSSTYPPDTAVWGNLANTPVRHHKFPDGSVTPIRKRKTGLGPNGQLFDGFEDLRLGITAANITYPSNDIIGHYIVRVERTDLTETVMDSAHLATLKSDRNVGARAFTGAVGSTYTGSGVFIQRPMTSDVCLMFAPRLYYKDNSLQGATYISLQYYSQPQSYSQTQSEMIHKDLREYPGDNPNHINFWGSSINLFNGGTALGSYTAEQANRKVKGIVVADPNTSLEGSSIIDYPFLNLNWIDRMAAIQFENDLPAYAAGTLPNESMHYAYIKRNISPYGNITGLFYKRCSPLMTAGSTNVIWGGDCFFNQWDYHFLSAARYHTAAGNQDIRIEFVTDSLFEMPAESRINVTLNVRGTGSGFDLPNAPRTSPPWDTNLYNTEDSWQIKYFRWFLRMGFDKSQTNIDWIPRGSWYMTYHAYNKDYNTILPPDVYVSLPITFKYDSTCLNDYPNRIIWSLASPDVGEVDNFRVNLAADYIDVGADTGAIKAFNYSNQRMWICTDSNLYITAPNTRELKSNQETIYLGTGSFLGIPPNRISTQPQGFGGCQHPHSAISTEFGWVYADAQAGEVFLIDQRPSRLSDKGMRNWFRENLPFSSSSGNAIIDDGDNGLFSFYDPRHKRYFLTKREFIPINATQWNNPTSPTQEGLYYNASGYFYITRTGTLRRITVGDPDHFENRSWSISYSFNHTAWDSFHSWMPSYAYANEYSIYSTEGDEQLWKHTYKNFQCWYGRRFDHVVEYIVPTGYTSNFETLQIYSRCRDWPGNNNMPDGIFDQAVVYNSNQSTGVMSLELWDKSQNPWGKRGWDNQTKPIFLSEHNYNLSGLRDIATSSVVYREDWQNVRSYFNLGRHGYMDRQFVNTNYNMSQYNLANLNDKYHIVRLIRTCDPTIKIFTEIVQTRVPQSII